MEAAGRPRLSAMRLHMKMRKAAPYLHALLDELTDKSPAAPERWNGYEFVAVDATAVSGPGADGTDARAHTALRLCDLKFEEVFVDDRSVGESFKRFQWSEGQLAIGDRGYANAPGIGWVVDHGADVLVRVNRGSLPLCDLRGERIDLNRWVNRLRESVPTERTISVYDSEKRRWINGRLVAIRLTEAQAQKARARLRREHGKSVSATDLEMARYVLLFTTVPQKRLSALQCVEAYRLRWQVELQFKRWKSLCGLDRLPNYRDDTIKSWLYAKVLLGVLLERMAQSAFPPVPSTRRVLVPAPAVEADFDPLAHVGRRAVAA